MGSSQSVSGGNLGIFESVYNSVQIRNRLCALVLVLVGLLMFYPLLAGGEYRSSSDFHAAVEMVGSLIGLAAGVLLIMRFCVMGDRFQLYIGLAFFVNGAEDLAHGVLAFRYTHAWLGLDPGAVQQFIPGTYVTGRILFGVILLLAPFMPVWMGRSGNPRKEAKLIGLIVGLLTIAVTVLAFMLPLPKFVFPDRFISRPVDLISAMIMAVALSLFILRFRKQRELLVWWVTLSIGIHMVGQIHMSFSKDLFDPFFDFAHLCKVAGYVIPLVGFGLYQIDVAKSLGEARDAMRNYAHSVGIAKDHAEQAIVDSNAKGELLAQMSEMAHVGGWEIDLQTMNIRWSEEVFRIHEVELDRQPGIEEAINYYTEEVRPTIRQAVEHAIATGEGFDLQLPMVTAKGRDIWVRVLGRAEKMGERVIRLWGAFQDVTQLKLATLKHEEMLGDLKEAKGMAEEKAVELANQANLLAEAQAMAEAASASKSEFLANMSHEIRTPMTAILGYADLLLDPNTSPEDQRNYIQTVKRNGDHLLTIINDILDLSKIESGKLTVESIDTPLIPVVMDVESMMRVRATERNIDLKIDFEMPLPQTIQSDPVRLRQILMNLVGNAVKFTKKGGVCVRVKLDGEESNFLRIDVIDSGIGLSQDQLMRLFKPFQQADSSTTRRFGGTGLGLIISQRLAHMLGGEIQVTSKEGVGSTFSVIIKVGAIDESELMHDLLDNSTRVAEAPDDGGVNAEEVLLNGRVLLAEDNPVNQKLATRILEKAGLTVETVENGKLAYEMAMTSISGGQAFDVILMDMQMPVMDGYTATRKLRHSGYEGAVIALTAHAMEGDREKCIDAGCDDYATKPFDKQKLLSIIAERLVSVEA